MVRADSGTMWSALYYSITTAMTPQRHPQLSFVQPGCGISGSSSNRYSLPVKARQAVHGPSLEFEILAVLTTPVALHASRQWLVWAAAYRVCSAAHLSRFLPSGRQNRALSATRRRSCGSGSVRNFHRRRGSARAIQRRRPALAGPPIWTIAPTPEVPLSVPFRYALATARASSYLPCSKRCRA